MLHHVKLVTGDNSKIVKDAPKGIKANVKLDKEVLEAMRKIMGYKPSDSASDILQGFIDKTFK